MKKNLLLPILLVFITFISCKKSDDDSNRDYYVTFKLNGTLVNHTGANHCWLKINSLNTDEVIFQMVSTSADFKNTLGITIQRNGAIGTQTYVNVPSAGYFPVIADYMQDSGQPNEKDYNNQDAPGQPANEFSITLTKIKDDYIKGTFTGNYLYDYAAGETIEITEGEFFVRRNN